MAVTILMVDDNAADQELVRQSLGPHIASALVFASNGEEALDRLRDETLPLPDLILLDLNMPRKNGHEVLAELQSDPVLRLIPVVVLTSSSAVADIFKSYSLAANAVVSKPPTIVRWKDVCAVIEGFWFGVALLPGVQHSA